MILGTAEAAQKIPFVPHNNLSDALDAYRHYLYGNGEDHTFSYERYVSSDLSGRITLKNALVDIQSGAEELYLLHFGGKSANFSITGTRSLAVAGMLAFPYPSTENWQKAIGYYNIWLSANVSAVKISTTSTMERLICNEGSG